MIDNTTTISWNQREFLTALNIFSPKESTLWIFKEVDIVLEFFQDKIPILDLCCGIGAIGICAILDKPGKFEKFYGFDNDIESIEVCKENILLHKIKGEAHIWEAGEELLHLKNGIAVCNPPFLPKSDKLDKSSSKDSLVYSDYDGLDVILRCFSSIKGTGHILILKSFRSQISKIINEVSNDFMLLREVEYEIEKGYIITFTTWKQK